MKQHVVTYVDLRFVVIATVEEYRVEFSIYDIVGHAVPSGADLYQLKTDEYSPTSDINDAAVFAHGEVKWDGCSNWHLDAQDAVMLHMCNRGDLTRVGEVLARCWDWTAQLLPTWDKEVTENG